MKILVTGAAGFIGYHASKHLCESGDEVIGIDNLNDYYDRKLKNERLRQLLSYKNFRFVKMDISDRFGIETLFLDEKFDRVLHLAAQAGVRYSKESPHTYAESNLTGFLNILEGSRRNGVEHLVYASSSSVYGANKNIPFSETDNVDHPVSLYAATKKANEAMAHSYSALYDLPTTGLRFFTVYGPWGRPDMSPMLFAKAIIEGKPIEIFNYGKHLRDFTYIDDIVLAINNVLALTARPDHSWSAENPSAATSSAPWRIYNVGNSKPVELLYFIECLEKSLSLTAKKIFLPMQEGDVENTYADVKTLNRDTGFKPNTPIEIGVEKFCCWYKEYKDNEL